MDLSYETGFSYHQLAPELIVQCSIEYRERLVRTTVLSRVRHVWSYAAVRNSGRYRVC